MTDPAKPSPESGTRVELPAEIVAAIDTLAETFTYQEIVAARAALVARLIEWGNERERNCPMCNRRRSPTEAFDGGRLG